MRRLHGCGEGTRFNNSTCQRPLLIGYICFSASFRERTWGERPTTGTAEVWAEVQMRHEAEDLSLSAMWVCVRGNTAVLLLCRSLSLPRLSLTLGSQLPSKCTRCLCDSRMCLQTVPSLYLPLPWLFLRAGNTLRYSAALLTASLSPDNSNGSSDGTGHGGPSLCRALTETRVASAA